MQALGAMLAADVSLYADGGGKRPAAMKPIVGFEAVHEEPGAHRGRLHAKIRVNFRARRASSTACRAS